jgi:lipoprotein-releasing system ATP-binding protein
MKKSLLSVSNVERSYSVNNVSLPVLDRASLQLNECESVALIGASGSGKSTLLHCMAGLDAPQSGEIFFRNQSIYDEKASWLDAYRKNQIGLIFQHYHLVEELDTLNNVLLASRSGWGNALLRKEAIELLDLLGLSQRLGHRPSELSGGEQQRVAIARALINKPALILADEPTGNLDAQTGEKVLHYLFQLVESRGHTLLLVTHDKEVATKCSRTLSLIDGKIK